MSFFFQALQHQNHKLVIQLEKHGGFQEVNGCEVADKTNVLTIKVLFVHIFWIPASPVANLSATHTATLLIEMYGVWMAWIYSAVCAQGLREPLGMFGTTSSCSLATVATGVADHKGH